MSEIETSRRNLLYGIAAAGAAVPVIAACGSDDTPSGSSDTPSDSGSTPSDGGSSPAAEAGIPTSDIPVGGGAIYPNEQIVVTQPTEGEFKAFSAVCTHARCLVNDVSDGQIQCKGCHGSRFSIEDGAPTADSPAKQPLAKKTVTVSGSTLTVS